MIKKPTKQNKENGELLQALVIEYRTTKDNNVLTQIIKLLNPFLSSLAARICELTRSEFDDIMQELVIVLMQRLEKYNPEKSKFLTYIHNSMKGDPTDTLQRMVKIKRGGDGKSKYINHVSLDAPVYDENPTTLVETLKHPSNNTEEAIFEHDVEMLKNDKKKLYKYLTKNTRK